MKFAVIMKVIIKRAWIIFLGAIIITVVIVASTHSPFYDKRYQINQQVLVKPKKELLVANGERKQTDFYYKIPIIASEKNHQKAFEFIHTIPIFKDVSNNDLERSFNIGAIPNSGIVNIKITTNNLKRGYYLKKVLVKFIRQSYVRILGHSYDIYVVGKTNVKTKVNIKKINLLFGVFSGVVIMSLLVLVYESWKTRRKYGK